MVDRFALLCLVYVVAKNRKPPRKLSARLDLVADAVRNYVLSFEGAALSAHQFIVWLGNNAPERLRAAAGFVFDPRRSTIAARRELEAFLDAARAAARAGLSPDLVQGGVYALFPKRIRQDAGRALPLMMFFNFALSRRNFYFLGRAHDYPLLSAFGRSPRRKEWRPPRVTAPRCPPARPRTPRFSPTRWLA